MIARHIGRVEVVQQGLLNRRRVCASIAASEVQPCWKAQCFLLQISQSEGADAECEDRQRSRGIQKKSGAELSINALVHSNMMHVILYS